ncbi:MAG: DMT family transporter [Barnesiella sp.]|nr:DMT family transporter [Barnesiella sp.]MBD5257370.1 DMT family transporter [Barnesiella sp.]
MEWILPALISASCLGVYDIFKKLSVKGNNVLMVLLLNTIFGALYLSPVIITDLAAGHFGLGDTLRGHILIVIKAFIVLGSWIMGYFAIKHLPLTIQGPINATRPVLVLVGALCIFGERLNALQWVGIIIGFASLYFISRIGAKEGFSLRRSRWLWLSIGAMVLGAVSALFDKYLLRSYAPLEVQAWYSLYQCVIMSILLLSLMRSKSARTDKFQWRWTIPCIALFLTVADLAYFHSLSVDGSMIAIVSMIRRGSVIIPFLYGVIVLHEKNVRTKLLDLLLLLTSLIILVIASK